MTAPIPTAAKKPMTNDQLKIAKVVDGKLTVGWNKLYVCPLCGYVDHDHQDGTGHWEQGTASNEHYESGRYSYWTLMCNGCGEITDMPLAGIEDVKLAISRSQK